MRISKLVVFILAMILGTVADSVGDKASSRSLLGEDGSDDNKMSYSSRKSVSAKELVKLTEIVGSLGGQKHHARLLLSAGKDFDIDPIFLASVTFVESSFRNNARSGRGAKGLMQLRPVVLGVLGVTNPWDPWQNIMAGAAYLRNCFDRYKTHKESTYLALAAYNVGPGSPERLLVSEAAQRFVTKVLRVYNKFTDEPVQLVNGAGKKTALRLSAWAEVLYND
jgi:hypothetical protein